MAQIEYQGEPHYLFAGVAEDFFPGEYLECESQLFEEAVLDAKAHLFEVLSEGDSSCVISMTGFSVVYHWTEDSMLRVVCKVPVSAVKVTAGIPRNETVSDPSISILPPEAWEKNIQEAFPAAAIGESTPAGAVLHCVQPGAEPIQDEGEKKNGMKDNNFETGLDYGNNDEP